MLVTVDRQYRDLALWAGVEAERHAMADVDRLQEVSVKTHPPQLSVGGQSLVIGDAVGEQQVSAALKPRVLGHRPFEEIQPFRCKANPHINAATLMLQVMPLQADNMRTHDSPDLVEKGCESLFAQVAPIESAQ
ncbi:hypothetical protein UUC_06502 [Rhodanobacter denitrificans]|nr:hypothetical protein UUC_06502 [Rhodanobacter denitrificans]